MRDVLGNIKTKWHATYWVGWQMLTTTGSSKTQTLPGGKFYEEKDVLTSLVSGEIIRE